MAKLVASFEACVPYSFLAVYDADLERPFNDWTERHCHQGFSWREGSVSFVTLASLGIKGEVWLAEEVQLLPQTQRAIQVPFTVPPSGRVGIDDEIVPIPPGLYLLVFENGLRDDIEDQQKGLGDTWCRLSFMPSTSPLPRILRETSGVAEGGDLEPQYPLLMTANPA